MKSLARSFFPFLIFTFVMSTFSEAYFPERRRDQFKGTPGYYIAPIPYRLTGIGEGFILLGAALNIMDTNTDAYGFAVPIGVRSTLLTHLSPSLSFLLLSSTCCLLSLSSKTCGLPVIPLILRCRISVLSLLNLIHCIYGKNIWRLP